MNSNEKFTHSAPGFSGFHHPLFAVAVLGSNTPWSTWSSDAAMGDRSRSRSREPKDVASAAKAGNSALAGFRRRPSQNDAIFGSPENVRIVKFSAFPCFLPHRFWEPYAPQPR